MNKEIALQQLECEFFGLYLEGLISNDYGLKIGDKYLKPYLKEFFDVTCKTWKDENGQQANSYAVRFLICNPKDKSIIFPFILEMVGGDKGYDYVIENNENIYNFIDDYRGKYIYFVI